MTLTSRIGSKELSVSYWQKSTDLITGGFALPKNGGMAIIGSGITGVSVAYWLTQNGFPGQDITIIDYMPEIAATNRNAGHVLYGAVESASALVSLKGEKVAREITELSIELCQDIKETVNREKLECDYRKSGYLVMALKDAEFSEIRKSVEILKSWGVSNEIVDKEHLNRLGFKNVVGGRFEEGSARINPVKFRNSLMEICLKRGVSYHSRREVKSLTESSGKVEVLYLTGDSNTFDACVVAANAFSPLLSSFYESRKLVEPFKGQIITSAPLKSKDLFKGAVSFNHGYEYSLITEDNRLLIGGWRDEAGGEMGSYDMTINPRTEEGLKGFVKDHFQIDEDIKWEHSWSGLMAASKTGLPFVGPTDSQLIYTAGGYTGHGLSWGHGCARILAEIMMGLSYTPSSYLLKPNLV